jgi:hypothetical protein
MTAVHADLITIADSVQILGPRRYGILGQTRDVADEPGDPEPLVQALANDLYETLYIRPSKPGGPRGGIWLVQREFLSALSAANKGQGTWEPGWTIRGLEGQHGVALSRQELDLCASAADVRTSDGRLTSGGRCSVRVPKEYRYLVKGYYLALGDCEIERDEPGPPGERQMRFYWHLSSETAAPLIAAATEILSASSVPFVLKVLRKPVAYARADAGVMYIGLRHVTRLGDAIARIYRRVAQGLRPEVPLLTLRLADGLALAEDPYPSSSFGQHRCRLIAKALWEASARGDTDRALRLASLAAAWKDEGLDPEHPYLGPGTALEAIGPAVEVIREHATLLASSGKTAAADRRSRSARLTPLEAAVKIGLHLCRTAHWDAQGRLCNWMGRSTMESTATGAIVPTTAALRPGLYAGSAGVSLFLAQLYALEGDDVFRRTAAGAIACSIRQLREKPSSTPTPLSLFVGHLGVAYAAHRVAALTGESGLGGAVDFLLGGLASELDKPHPLDLIGGNAGAIPALLALSRSTGGTRERDLAIALGEQLCGTAMRREGTWSWDPEVASGPGTATAPLTGLSHGASGIGVALLELHAETGRLDFLEVGRGALTYEDSLFEPETGNWPDLRRRDDPPGRRGSPTPPMSGPVASTPLTPPSQGGNARAWCHGAPGIALARLRAMTLDRPRAEAYRATARAAIATTLDAIDENLPRPNHDASLCHGLSGLLEISLIASSACGGLGDPEYTAKAVSTARVLIDRHAQAVDYPSGLISGAVNPSLMLGLAGTGYALLRLHAPDHVPSILLAGAPVA